MSEQIGPDEPPESSAEASAIVEVYSAADVTEAHLIRNLLDAAGIEARGVGDDLQTAAGGLPLGQSTLPRIWAKEADRLRAQQIIGEWETEHGRRSDDVAVGVWICPGCGGEIDDGVDSCPTCDALPGRRKDPDRRPKSDVVASHVPPEASSAGGTGVAAMKVVICVIIISPFVVGFLSYRAGQRDPYTHYLQGTGYFDEGEYEKAVASFDKAISLDPTVADFYSNRAWALLRIGKCEEAIDDFNKAIRLDCSLASDFCGRGYAYRMLGNHREAIVDYETAIETDSRDQISHSNLAWLLATCSDRQYRNVQQAMKHARRACKLADWKDWVCLDALAVACAASGDFDQAVEWETKALALAPENEKAECRRILELYKAGEVYREENVE